MATVMGCSSCVGCEGVCVCGGGVEARLHGTEGNSSKIHPPPRLMGMDPRGSIAYEVGWALEGTWTFRERQKETVPFNVIELQSFGFPSHIRITIPTELPWPLIYFVLQSRSCRSCWRFR